MRLLDTHVFPPPPPKDEYAPRRYAILSHTWDREEVVLSDLYHPDQAAHKVVSWDKIRGAQAQAKKDGFDFIWIDTLCIDKSSSAELGEAINSMYRWYHEAEVCLVYLGDVTSGGRQVGPEDDDLIENSVVDSNLRTTKQQLRQSRWFQRGWTLQELLAPRQLRFYDQLWEPIRDLSDLSATISEITRIPSKALPDLEYDHQESHKQNKKRVATPSQRRAPLPLFSIAQRMSWAANRQTTRPEDRAYSLLGILDVSLDVRYGEGSRAFIRLQEELIARSADQSILVWTTKPHHRYWNLPTDATLDEALLAPSPDAFAESGAIVPLPDSPSYALTNLGLNLTASVIGGPSILLNCRHTDDPTVGIVLNVISQTAIDKSVGKKASKPPRFEIVSRGGRLGYTDMSLAKSHEPWPLTISRVSQRFDFDAMTDKEEESHPRCSKLWLVLDGYAYLSNEYRHWPANDRLNATPWFKFQGSAPEAEVTTRTPTYNLPRGLICHAFVIRLCHESSSGTPQPFEVHIVLADDSTQHQYLQISSTLSHDMTATRDAIEKIWHEGNRRPFHSPEPLAMRMLTANYGVLATVKVRWLSNEWARVLEVKGLFRPSFGTRVRCSLWYREPLTLLFRATGTLLLCGAMLGALSCVLASRWTTQLAERYWDSWWAGLAFRVVVVLIAIPEIVSCFLIGMMIEYGSLIDPKPGAQLYVPFLPREVSNQIKDYLSSWSTLIKASVTM